MIYRSSVYMAGPMANLPARNYPAFREFTAQWRDSGWSVISPHEAFGEEASDRYQQYMRLDIHSLLCVDAIALMPGWEKSQGAQTELGVALGLGLNVYDALTMKPLRVKRGVIAWEVEQL